MRGCFIAMAVALAQHTDYVLQGATSADPLQYCSVFAVHRDDSLMQLHVTCISTLQFC